MSRWSLISSVIAVRGGELKLAAEHHDSVSRLLELSPSKTVNFDVKRVLVNVGGLLIGAVETMSHAVVNALDTLMKRPTDLAKSRAAALSDDAAAVDGFVFEALRLKPAFPYIFRMCEQDTLGRGEPFEARITKGTIVLAVTHSAMFDPKSVSNPNDFNPNRGQDN